MFVKRKQTSKQTKQFKQTPAAGSMLDAAAAAAGPRCSMFDPIAD
jgi:hypothetical protein